MHLTVIARSQMRFCMLPVHGGAETVRPLLCLQRSQSAIRKGRNAVSLNKQRMFGLIERLRAKTLPQISGYTGDYTDDDYVLETFAEAADEIERIRKTLDLIARCDFRATVNPTWMIQRDLARDALKKNK